MRVGGEPPLEPLPAKEKAAKQAAKWGEPRKVPAKKPTAPVRMKIVWNVCGASGTALKSFAYAERGAAEAYATSRTQSSGRTHVVRASKVPME